MIHRPFLASGVTQELFSFPIAAQKEAHISYMDARLANTSAEKRCRPQPMEDSSLLSWVDVYFLKRRDTVQCGLTHESRWIILSNPIMISVCIILAPFAEHQNSLDGFMLEGKYVSLMLG